MRIYERIKYELFKQGKSQTWLSMQTGIPKSHISTFLNGSRDFRSEKLERIVKAFGKEWDMVTETNRTYNMDLQQIRDQIIHQLMYDIELWSEVTDGTSPGNYGVEDWEIIVNEDNLYVDIPNRAFSFKDVEFIADFILGASKGDSSTICKYHETSNGNGKFDFIDKRKIRVESIDVEIDLDLFK